MSNYCRASALYGKLGVFGMLGKIERGTNRAGDGKYGEMLKDSGR